MDKGSGSVREEESISKLFDKECLRRNSSNCLSVISPTDAISLELKRVPISNIDSFSSKSSVNSIFSSVILSFSGELVFGSLGFFVANPLHITVLAGYKEGDAKLKLYLLA